VSESRDKMPGMFSGPRLDRVALVVALGLVAANLAVTGRWAPAPGAPPGWRWWVVFMALVVLAVSTTRVASPPWQCPPRVARLLLLGGFTLLAGAFLVDWFPPTSWSLIPFTDDWPPRFSSTVEGLALLRRGAFVGWQWNLLGGYPSATDITQNLTLLGALPMTLLGNTVGFHLLHLGLFLALPALVFVDLALTEEPRLAAAAAGLMALTAYSLLGIVTSGDTNSLAGVVTTMGVLVASHRARAGTRGGFPVLVLALAVAAYSHLAFFFYAVGLLVVEAAYYTDWRHARRGLVAALLALVVSLPLTFELIRYPTYFNFNNVLYEPPAHINWMGLVRKVAYNVQILFLPARWLHDVTRFFGPLVLLAAWRREGRVGFYAWAALFVVGLTCLNVPEVGYLFARPSHLLAVFTPVVLAGFGATRSSSPWQAASVILIAMFVAPVAEERVPHQPSVAAFVPSLVDRLRTLDGHLVVVENNPHRDVDASPTQTSERSLYGTHYEALLPAATGKRLYAGYWDGWQWTPYRGDMLAAGAWRGHTLTDADRLAFVAELRRWGIRHLLVWSHISIAALGRWPEFTPRWEDGRWREFELTSPPIDTRAVVTDHGRGELVRTDPLGGLVRLVDVREGDRVVVRTHYHPAWAAFAGVPLATGAVDGQLAFAAPSNGSYDVTLVYPARRGLLVVSALVMGAVVVWDRRRSTRRAGA
jgi:hypothetical protein